MTMPMTPAQLRETLTTMAAQMRAQDNLGTNLPIFVVRQKRRIYGVDPDHHSKAVRRWFNEDGDEVSKEEAAATIMVDGEAQYTRVWCIDIDENVQPFFTKKAAQAYIDANRHNLDRPHIYVESGYRNVEWQAVRELLTDSAMTFPVSPRLARKQGRALLGRPTATGSRRRRRRNYGQRPPAEPACGDRSTGPPTSCFDALARGRLRRRRREQGQALACLGSF